MTLPELESLVSRFEDCTLSREAWNHRAHLAVATWYSFHLPRDTATVRIRKGIQRYNASQGNTKGYHETITLAWIALVARLLREAPAKHDVLELVNEVTAKFGTPEYLQRHFSKERLFSELARREWVEPDLSPLE